MDASVGSPFPGASSPGIGTIPLRKSLVLSRPPPPRARPSAPPPDSPPDRDGAPEAEAHAGEGLSHLERHKFFNFDTTSSSTLIRHYIEFDTNSKSLLHRKRDQTNFPLF